MVKEMTNNTQTSITQRTISIKSYLSTVLRYWKILLPIVLVCFLALTFYSAFLATPMYKSTAKLYIINKSSASNQITSTDFNISTYLTKDFAEILKDEVVLSEVAEDLSNKYTISTINSFLNVKATEDTRIIEISVTSPNAKDSKQIADSICRISEEKLVEIMGLDRVKVIRNGNLAKRPFSPNVKMDAMKGLVIGMFFAAAAAFLILVTDNRISSSTDVEKILELSILTTIPYTERKLNKR